MLGRMPQVPAASEARLITVDELSSFGYEYKNTSTSGGINMGWVKGEYVPSWIYNSKYEYYTMSSIDDSTDMVWLVDSAGNIVKIAVYIPNFRLRPVIVLPKPAL